MTRRTQADRRACTQQALEEAAIDALVERGVSGASVNDICRRAGVSQGALFQHYPTKQALLTAAVARLYDRLRDEFRQELSSVRGDRVRGALVLVWQTFAQPEVVATLELWSSSRTDEALRVQISPMLDAFWADLAAEAVASFPFEAAANPNFDVALGLVLAAVQSAAIGAVISRQPPPQLERTLDVAAALIAGRTP